MTKIIINTGLMLIITCCMWSSYYRSSSLYYKYRYILTCLIVPIFTCEFKKLIPIFTVYFLFMQMYLKKKPNTIRLTQVNMYKNISIYIYIYYIYVMATVLAVSWWRLNFGFLSFALIDSSVSILKMQILKLVTVKYLQNLHILQTYVFISC